MTILTDCRQPIKTFTFIIDLTFTVVMTVTIQENSMVVVLCFL